MKIITKVLTFFVFPVIIVGLAFLIYRSIAAPEQFKKEKEHRTSIATKRLVSIRTLQVSFKSKYGHYSSTIDSLINFYNNDQVIIIKQVGSADDSLAVAQKRVFRDSIKINVRDTLFKNETNFIVDSIKYIPFSGKKEIIMESTIKKVSGVNVPLFEATIPFEDLLVGLDRQMIVNLKAECEALNRYEGLKVGSITNPNNNAGNWE